MDYIKNTMIIIIIVMFGYSMYLSNMVNKTKVRIDESKKELNLCRSSLNYYKWVFNKRMSKEEYLQGEDKNTTSNRWKHNSTFNIPINLTGIKNRPP